MDIKLKPLPSLPYTPPVPPSFSSSTSSLLTTTSTIDPLKYAYSSLVFRQGMKVSIAPISGTRVVVIPSPSSTAVGSAVSPLGEGRKSGFEAVRSRESQNEEKLDVVDHDAHKERDFSSFSMKDHERACLAHKQRKRQTKELPPLPYFLESDSDSQSELESELTKNTAQIRNHNREISQDTNATTVEDNQEPSEILGLGSVRFWDREKGGWEFISVGEKELKLLKLEKRRGRKVNSWPCGMGAERVGIWEMGGRDSGESRGSGKGRKMSPGRKRALLAQEEVEKERGSLTEGKLWGGVFEHDEVVDDEEEEEKKKFVEQHPGTRVEMLELKEDVARPKTSRRIKKSPRSIKVVGRDQFVKQSNASNETQPSPKSGHSGIRQQYAAHANVSRGKQVPAQIDVKKANKRLRHKHAKVTRAPESSNDSDAEASSPYDSVDESGKRGKSARGLGSGKNSGYSESIGKTPRSAYGFLQEDTNTPMSATILPGEFEGSFLISDLSPYEVREGMEEENLRLVKEAITISTMTTLSPQQSTPITVTSPRGQASPGIVSRETMHVAHSPVNTISSSSTRELLSPAVSSPDSAWSPLNNLSPTLTRGTIYRLVTSPDITQSPGGQLSPTSSGYTGSPISPSADLSHLNRLVEEERARYDREYDNLSNRQWGQEIAGIDHRTRVSPPLILASRKNRPLHIELGTKTSILQSMRDSWEIGVEEVNSMSPSLRRRGHGNIPVSPMYSMESDFLSLPYEVTMEGVRPKRVDNQVETAMPSPKDTDLCSLSPVQERGSNPACSIGRKLTTAKKLFGRDRSATLKPKVLIPNSQRTLKGPDTPTVSSKSGLWSCLPSLQSLHRMGKTIQQKFAKAKMSSEERRSEKLKKKIVVVGITDQSPGKR